MRKSPVSPVSPVSDVSAGELEVLKVLWTRGPGTVRDVAAQLRRGRRRPAYNTVLTLLGRLRDKGYVAADRSSTAHIFQPLVSRDQLLTHGLKSLAARVCDGVASPLVHALVKGERFSPAEIASFRRLLDDLEDEAES
jgi:BlaI family penicillinase repressor